MPLRVAAPVDIEAFLDVREEGAVHGRGRIFPQAKHPFPRDAVAARWWAEMDDPAVDVHLHVDDDGTVHGFAATRGHELLHFGTALATWGSGLASQSTTTC